MAPQIKEYYLSVINMIMKCDVSEHNDATCQKMLVWKQYDYWFSTILQSTLQTWIENSNGLLRNAKD